MHAPPDPSASLTPSASLLDNLQRELIRHLPFAQMQPAHVARFIAAAEQLYFAPEEAIVSPAHGPVRHLYCIREGSVTGRRGLADYSDEGGLQYEAGDLFPVAPLLGDRAATATYTANEDCFCLRVDAAFVRALADESPPFADFLQHRVLRYLELARRAVQAAYASDTLAQQALEAPLGTLPRKSPLTCTPDTPLGQALGAMHERRVGSVLAIDADGVPLGILTRYDILGRVTLPGVPLDTPFAQVMSKPVRTLDVAHTAQDAALLMSRHGIRHVPITEGGRIVSIVSERDLFALQRLSLKQVSSTLREAASVAQLQAGAADIREFARHLIAQGVQARQMTELISHLNDLLTERLVALLAQEHGLDMDRACWLAFGSEGRSEQTIATDQDNGIIFESDDPDRDRPRWLAFGKAVNQALDACGYPLCKGGVMAGNRSCCLTAHEWHARFDHWMEHGAPEDLLNASIYFDLRPIAGRAELAAPLRAFITARAAALPRFRKQMADNALRCRAPLNWLGSIETETQDGHDMLDLKMRGTALFVDVARLYALAHGIAETNTCKRIEAVARVLDVDAQEAEAWCAAFEFLQMLRLNAQIDRDRHATGNPNLVAVDSLNAIDRRVLREALRVARELQQRMQMDYAR